MSLQSNDSGPTNESSSTVEEKPLAGVQVDEGSTEMEYQPVSCMQQTLALVRKNLLNKKRTPVGTVLELISPALFMVMLVVGYTLSEEFDQKAGIYSSWEFDLPNDLLTGAVLNVINEGTGLGNFSINTPSRRNLLEEKLSKLDFLFDHDEADGQEEVDNNRIYSSNSHLFQWKNAHQIFRMLQTDTDTQEESDDDGTAGYVDVARSLRDLRKELKRLLRSPVPIPTLPQYLTLSQTLSSQFNPNELDSVYQTSNYIRRWGNLLTLGTIHLSPRGSLVDEFIQYLEDVHSIQNISSSIVLEDRPNATSVLFRVHDDAESSTEYVMNNLNERTFVSIHFNEENENDFEYTMRMNSTTLPNTNQITRWVSIGLDDRYQRYFFSGHLTLQRTVNEFAIWRTSNDTTTRTRRQLQSDQCAVPDTSSWDVYSMPMPTPAYSQNPFFTAVGFLLGLVIAMSFLYPVSRLIKSMVEEKETRMKETLSILGVKPLAQWSSWIITAAISSVIIAIFVTIILSAVMIYSSKFYLFIYILLFSFAVSGFAFFISAFFSRANLAAIVGPIGLFATLLPRWIFFGTNRYEATVSKKWASLLPCTAFAFGADILSDYEYAQVGIQKDNLKDGYYNFNTTLGFLFFDTILYIVLGWYLEQIIPRQYGVAKKWYFPLTPSFWRETLGLEVKNSPPRKVPDSESMESIENGTVEIVPAQAKLKIQNLVKIYNPKKPPAVNNLNLSMFESEITCLLGHNGAGKSSTISVITGLYPPTSGDCTIYGRSILRDMAQCRQSMGICPQQNVLFGNLTVLEHLRFFERIKGVSSQDIEDRAREVGLCEFFDTRAGNLSGGNKRKLQLAIALTGAPKLVLLDEPTSGMDPYSRRATWELLRRKRHGRIILLTTHFMDEAEVLADRVAILKEGRLQCCGSVMFLKQRFGLGYNITIMIEKLMEEDTDIPMKDIQANIGSLLEDFVPGTRFIRESARELVYRFPPGSESYFPSLFDALEKNAADSHLSTYGVSNTSLEEVFLELAEDEEEDDSDDKMNKVPSELNESKIIDMDNLKYLGALSQISLLLHKRLVIERRDLKGLFFKVVVPVVLICLVLLILLIEIPIEGTPIKLTAELYNTSGTGASVSNNMIVAGSSSNQRDAFVETLDGVYPSMEMSMIPDLTTSADVSDYILEGLQENRREFNFGSFVFGDKIGAQINVDWSQMGNGNDLLPILDNLIFSQLDSTQVINTLNQTLTLLNVPFADVYISTISQILENGGSIADVVDTTVLFFNIDSDQLEEALLNSLFNGVDDVSFGGQNWTLTLSKDAVQGYFDGVNATYEISVDVPVSIMHNTSSSHSVAVFTQTYYDHLYKKCATSPHSKLSVINQPLPLTSQQSTEIRTILSIIAAMLLAIPFNYIPAAFAVFVVKERACKSKHLQLVSGVDMLAYWVSTYIWDFTSFMILTLLTMAGFASFGEVSVVFSGSVQSFFCTFSIIVGYGLSSLPFAYLLSRKFDNPPNAQISIMIIFFITGFIAVNAYFILDSIDSTKQLAKILQPLFRTWPAYNLGEAFLNLASNFWEQQISSDAPSPFSWDACGRSLFLLYFLSIPYFLWLMLLEFSSDGGSGGRFGKLMRAVRASAHRMHNRLSDFRQIPQHETDEDVLEEEQFVNERTMDLMNSSPVVISSLWKVFPKGSLLSVLLDKILFMLCRCFRSANKSNKEPKVAVNNLSLHVENGITMGLLGVNGAGKTTTMGILTGDITPTSGEGFVAGNDVTGRTQDGVQLARKNIGFCPQVDPLLDLMTGRETLSMFGMLRGIPSDILNEVVDDLLAKLTLTPHADKVSQNYSGGNKRKLSLGVALVGNPKVLFIDESSSGMDPSARRKIWDLLSEAAKDRAVILTTHSMEEAEALCNKVAIMIQGRIRCLGGVQHLKQKFLGGYTVSLSCNGTATEGEINAVESEVLEFLSSAQLSERHGRYLKFELGSFENVGEGSVTSLGELFGRFQEMVENEDSCVASYSISQCTLEQVFINLVREEEETSVSSSF